MQNSMLGDLLSLCAKCTILFESPKTSAPLASPLSNNSFMTFVHTARVDPCSMAHCLQLSVKHTLHFITALYNAVWSTKCFKCVCLIFQANLQGISKLCKSKYLKCLKSPTMPDARLGTQKTPPQFFSIDYPGVLRQQHV